MQKRIGVLVDSSCTYDETFLRQHKIEVIPLSFSDAQNQTYDDDNQSITREKLLERLDQKESFKTSATPIGKLIEKAEQMLKNYDQIIFLPISIGLSSQYMQSLIVQQDLIGKFFPIRSTSGGAANEFVLYKIVELIAANKDVAEIIAAAENMYKYIDTYFSCEDLSGMSSGGRITKTIMKVINLFKLKPIIHLDNKNLYGGIGKNYRTIIRKIIDLIKEDFHNSLTVAQIKHIAIYYSGYPETKKNDILDFISQGFNFPREKILVRWVPSVVLIHAHRGAYGLTIETTIERKVHNTDE
ncbi:MAG: DegV family protein [Mycoplasmataceae bacterium]|jgi:DegV family protein with EDD domain|nr:DegV family protein [Mycoplasmataceae bacterium]